MRLVHSSLFDASVEEVFAFHERPDALELLSPPWEKIRVVQGPTSLEAGTVVLIDTRVLLFWLRIEAVHTAYEKNVRFVDEMRRGPFKRWRHEHRFERDGTGCRLTDEIEYTPPLGPLGRLADPFVVRPRLKRMFEHRHAVTRRGVESRRAGAESVAR